MNSHSLHRGFSVAVKAERVVEVEAHVQRRRPHDWGGLTLSMVLAIGFAATFLTPVWLQRPVASTVASTDGVVLGEAESQALEVTVEVRTPGYQRVLTVQPTGGTLTEALAKAASHGDSGFVYATRGGSIYVDTFFGLTQGNHGSWAVSINGLPVADLSQASMSQADQVVVTWTPSS